MKEFDEYQELYDAILTLESSQWWIIYKDWLESELKATEEIILTTDEDNNVVKHTWYDILRSEREYLKAMLKFTTVKKDEYKPWIE